MEDTTQNTLVEKKSIFKKPHIQSVVGIVVILLALGAVLFWKSVSSYVGIEMSEIKAPLIVIGPEAAGILEQTLVKAGDRVEAGEPLAQVGSETLYAKVSGVVLTALNTPGQVVPMGGSVVTMIDPKELRVVGKLDENKGLSKIKVGDSATFTVDAFKGEEFTGVVDEISETSNQSGVVFNISDKREIKQFEVKVRYDEATLTRFKNGMSAKLKIYTK